MAATAAGLLLPPTLAQNAETARRYWPGWSPPRAMNLHQLPMLSDGRGVFWLSDPGDNRIILSGLYSNDGVSLIDHHPDIDCVIEPDGRINVTCRGALA
jgi:hypothetical protein